MPHLRGGVKDISLDRSQIHGHGGPFHYDEVVATWWLMLGGVVGGALGWWVSGSEGRHQQQDGHDEAVEETP